MKSNMDKKPKLTDKSNSELSSENRSSGKRYIVDKETHVVDTSEIISFLWEKQEFLRSHYKKNKYGTVILPLVVLARLDAELRPTKQKVLAKIKELKSKGIKVGPAMDDDLNRITKQRFNNKSEFEDLKDLLSEPKDIKSNLEDYVDGFSSNIHDIFDKFKIKVLIKDLKEKNILWNAVEHFAKYSDELGKIDNIGMGIVYEELIRRANEASHETAGDHFTPRDVIKLLVNIIFSPDMDQIMKTPQTIRVIYDPAAGTGGMLSESIKFLEDHISKDVKIGLVGQDINDEAYAICKSDMMIRGVEPDHIQYGNSLISEDKFPGQKFDYIISNPPYGRDWKDFSAEIEKEHKKKGGRYDVGLPRTSDSALLFLQHIVSKMHTKNSDKTTRVAIVFNGSPLFTGDAESGESEIRKWILSKENDYLETIIALPKDLFYNTGINTYIWILTNKKDPKRKGKVQLINAVDLCKRMGRGLSSKRNEIKETHIAEVKSNYDAFQESKISKIFDNEEFGYAQITVERPLKRNYSFSDERIEKVKLESVFLKLTESKKKGPTKEKEEQEGKKNQEQIIQVLKSANKSKVYKDCNQFEEDLKDLFDKSKVSISKGLLKSIQYALSEHDETATTCKDKKGNQLADSDLRDTEKVPLKEDIDEYFKREVLPYVPDAWIKDSTRTKIGYEFPVTRVFYEYKPLRSIDVIDSEIKKLQKEISDSLEDLMD